LLVWPNILPVFEIHELVLQRLSCRDVASSSLQLHRQLKVLNHFILIWKPLASSTYSHTSRISVTHKIFIQSSDVLNALIFVSRCRRLFLRTRSVTPSAPGGSSTTCAASYRRHPRGWRPSLSTPPATTGRLVSQRTFFYCRANASHKAVEAQLLDST
jgi:hypothetical protein